ncbi:MAG: Xaa-Pro peptidase family protein [Candidatus Bathyarchaeota archaeon]|nr:Xaa-Pro peptidase family protein [Candidatus Bathyarchaeota archaeon]
MNFERRLVGLQEKMMENNVDLVIYGSCQNFQYLTGLLIDWRHGIDLGSEANNIFVPRTGEPILTLAEDWTEQASKTWVKDVRILKRDENYGEFLKKVMFDLDLEKAKIGLGDHLWGTTIAEISKIVKGVEFFKAEGFMRHLRMIKDEEEIEKLRNVAELTDKVMEATVPKIREGVTQRQLELEVEFCGKSLGASDVSFPSTAGFVKSNSEISPNPFTYPKEKGLVRGTSVAFDIGFVMDGYCSDFGRSFYFGPASTEVRKGYEALQQAVIETVDKMHDGSMRVCDLFPLLESVLDRLGYGDYLRARLPTKNLGHNIGVEVHEPPWLSPAYAETLRESMVIALEPKLWHAGEYYLRVEDMVLVKKRKTEFLTNFDRKLFQL